MRKSTMLYVILALSIFVVISCEQKAEQPAEVTPAQKPTASLAEIVPSGAILTTVTEGIEFDTAGSPCYADGNLSLHLYFLAVCRSHMRYVKLRLFLFSCHPPSFR